MTIDRANEMISKRLPKDEIPMKKEVRKLVKRL